MPTVYSIPNIAQCPFTINVAALLQRADLAISRAGSGSLTELAITQTPAILIPFPYAAEDHQFHNAIGFMEAGAARLFRQEHLSPPTARNRSHHPAQRLNPTATDDHRHGTISHPRQCKTAGGGRPGNT